MPLSLPSRDYPLPRETPIMNKGTKHTLSIINSAAVVRATEWGAA